MSDKPTTQSYGQIARECTDEAAVDAIRELMEQLDTLNEQNAALIANAETVATIVIERDELTEQVGTLTQNVSDLQSDLADAKQDAADATDKHQKATKANAELAKERDAAKALLQTALKAQKRAENALSNAQSQNSASDATIHSIGTELNEAVLERDALRSKNSDLHKQVERLTEAKRNQDRAIQTFVGAASKPVSGPGSLVFRSIKSSSLNVMMPMHAGETFAGFQVVGASIVVAFAMTAAAVEPVPDDVPERETVEPEQLQDAA